MWAATTLYGLRPMTSRNPHAGQSFEDDDSAIAAALEDVSVPALLCSLVHMTGDPSWIRGTIKPRIAVSLEFQSGIPENGLAGGGSLGPPAVRAFPESRLPPPPPPHELLREIMEFLGCRPV